MLDFGQYLIMCWSPAAYTDHSNLQDDNVMGKDA